MQGMGKPTTPTKALGKMARGFVRVYNQLSALAAWTKEQQDAFWAQISPAGKLKVECVAREFIALAKVVFTTVLSGFTISLILWFLGLADPVHWRDSFQEFYDTLTVTESRLVMLGMFLGYLSFSCSVCKFTIELRDLFFTRVIAYAQHTVLVGAGAALFFGVMLHVSELSAIDWRTVSFYIFFGSLLAVVRLVLRAVRQRIDGKLIVPLVITCVAAPFVGHLYSIVSELDQYSHCSSKCVLATPPTQPQSLQLVNQKSQTPSDSNGNSVKR